jgi:hypothetical protein
MLSQLFLNECIAPPPNSYSYCNMIDFCIPVAAAFALAFILYLFRERGFIKW